MYKPPTNKKEIVTKPWGREEILVKNYFYCLKRLYVNADARLSLQYHMEKLETMILERGECILQIDNHAVPMAIDIPYTISPLTKHRLWAVQDSVILEVSTPELDDVVRLDDDYDRVEKKGTKSNIDWGKTR